MAGLGRLRGTAPLLFVGLAACSQSTDMSLLDAYLEPQRPLWAGMAPPAPIPAIARDIQLVGMATGDLRDVFGEPALVRHEGGVQYWRYSFTGCTLDLFVNTGSDGSSEVVYFDLRPSTHYGNGVAEAECTRLGQRLERLERPVPEGRDLPPVESF
jgi:hypothetical protein